MKTYTVTIAANIRAYAMVTIEAKDEDAAAQRAQDIASSGRMWEEPEMQGIVFEPEYDTMTDFEPLDDLEEDPPV